MGTHHVDTTQGACCGKASPLRLTGKPTAPYRRKPLPVGYLHYPLGLPLTSSGSRVIYSDNSRGRFSKKGPGRRGCGAAYQHSYFKRGSDSWEPLFFSSYTRSELSLFHPGATARALGAAAGRVPLDDDETWLASDPRWSSFRARWWTSAAGPVASPITTSAAARPWRSESCSPRQSSSRRCPLRVWCRPANTSRSS